MAGTFYLHNLSFKATVSASAAIVSSSETSATIRVTATGSIPSGYNVTSTGVVANITINGQSSGHKTIFGYGTYYAGSEGAKSVSWEITVDKGTSAKSISWSVDFRNAYAGSGVITGTANNGIKHTESGTVSVPAKTSYTIAYNANGGSGAPGSQTKWYGVTLTLSSTVPTRTGYTFQGWALSKAEANASTWYYQPGGTCGKNENLTLYAVWKANTYTVKYNANGGTGAPGKQTKTYGVSLKLSSTVPTRTNYTFKGWGTSASATKASYQPGGTYSANSAITLYAIWELNYVKPRITNLSVDRYTSNGTPSESGTYAHVTFNWACDREVSSIVVSWMSATGGSGSESIPATGTSGSVVNRSIGSGGFSEESTYTITVTVTDAIDSFPKTTILNGIRLAIDIHAGADGIAFGMPAELAGVADFGFDARFNKGVYGNAVGLSQLPQIPSNASLNSYMNPGCYAISTNAMAATVSDLPSNAAGAAGRLFVADAIGAGNSDGYVYRRQVYIPYRVGYGFSVRDLTSDSNGAWTYGDWYTYMPTKA